MLDLSHQIFAHLDEPIADSSLLPTYLVMQEAKKCGITVLLSGDGADESFGGYPTYQAHTLQSILQLIPQMSINPTHSPFSPSFIIDRFNRGKHESWWKRHQLWMSAWLPSDFINVHDDFWNSIEYWVPKEEVTKKRTNISNHLYLDQRLYLREGVLTKVDRSSGAFGIEVRSPFLDQYIVELAAQIPLKAKIWRHRKGILRQILQKYYPKMNVKTSKKGFGSPVSEFLRSQELSVFQSNHSKVYDFVSFEKTQQYHQQHAHQQKDHRKRLWSLYVLDSFFKNQ